MSTKSKEKDLPILVHKKLAKVVGLKESLFITRIIQLSKLNNENVKTFEELVWVKRTLKEWNSDFDFLTPSTINRLLIKLKDNFVIHAENLNDDKRDKTLWYAINICEIDLLLNPISK